MLDHFQVEDWCKEGKKDNSDSVCCDITEALSAVGNYDGVEGVYTWDRYVMFNFDSLPHCSKSSFFVQKFNFDFP